MEDRSLASALAVRTTTAAPELTLRESDGRLRCVACGHRCLLSEGREGTCRVRYVRDNDLRVPRGYAAALQVDPIEKKPFYHAHPGTAAMSFGMMGCDLHCSYCQNWVTSQALRDPDALAPVRDVEASDLVKLALDNRASAVVSTYNEPLITSEWAVEVFQAARVAGLDTAYVSNGNGTPEVLDYLRPHVNLFKVDLKGFDDRRYRQLGGTLKRCVETIEGLAERGYWVEVVTLIVPGFNDGDEELRNIARFLASVSPDIPWHVTAFHEDYKMIGCGNTQAESLLRAAEYGREAGIHFVYAGNIPGSVNDFENTRCPDCHGLIIERFGFRVLNVRLEDGCCPDCRREIPGVWATRAESAGSSPGSPRPLRDI